VPDHRLSPAPLSRAALLAVAAAAVALLAAALPAAAAAPATEGDAECAGSAPHVYPSPDGRHRAAVQEQACVTADGGAAAAIVVIVAPDATPDDGRRALSIAVPRSREDWPRPRWRNATTLEVWVPNLAKLLGEVARQVDGIDVELHYCQDNPADRQAVVDHQAALTRWMQETTAWARRRKETPGSEGPRPQRPQEPRIAPGRCDPAQFPPAAAGSPPAAAPPAAATAAIAAGSACTPADGLDAVCGVVAGEDVVALPGTPWLLVGGLDVGGGAQLHLVDRGSGRVVAVPVAATAPTGDATAAADTSATACTPPGPRRRVSLAGLALRPEVPPGQVQRLFAANQAEPRSIEFFDVDDRAAVPVLAWRGCVPMPDGTLPNAVVALRGGGFIASSFHDPRDTAAEYARMARGEPTGSLWQWSAAGGLHPLPAGPLAGANGLALTADESTLYVSEWAARRIVALDARSGARRLIPVDFLPDNLRVEADGRLLVAGQRADVAAIGACAGPACPQPWVVARIDPRSGQVTPLLSRAGTAQVSYACGALALDGRLYVTARSDARLLSLPLASLPSLR
jgi:hypothetical protein